MSNKPHLRVVNKRAGLVQITISDDGKVWLELFPPGKAPVQLPMLPADARGLAQGLLEGAEAAESGADT